MNRLYYFLSIVSVMIIAAGCQKFLDKQPKDVIPRAEFFNSVADYERSITYTYNTLQSLYSGSGHYYWGWSGEEGYGNRSSFTSTPSTYNQSAAFSHYQAVWSYLYNGIREANNLLDAIANKKVASVSDSLSNKYKAEALFLRGYYYFQLVQLYGGVPLRLEPSRSTENLSMPKSSIREVYAQVLKDMEEAETLLPEITAIGNGGRLSKSAARGILARVNLTMAGRPLKDESRYNEVKKWCQKIFDSNLHSLNPNYHEVFINYAADKYDYKESIWEVEFWGNGTDKMYAEQGQIGSAVGPTSANAETGMAYGYTGITRKMYDVFGLPSGDMRKWYNIAFFDYQGTAAAPRENGAKVYKGTPSSARITVWYAYCPGKFRREYETFTPKGVQSATPQNFPLLRYADVLLMYAEAENELNGPTQDALDKVNEVRRRAWSTGIVDGGIRVTANGSGYDAAKPPLVTISGGGGTGAKAVATVSASGTTKGRVTAVTMVLGDSILFWTRGAGYSGVPTITITDTAAGGVGKGATAVVTGIYNKTQADVPTTAAASKDAFRTFLQDERMRELCTECLRKFDLIRWGNIFEVYQQVAAQIAVDYKSTSTVQWANYGNIQPRDTLWPIPSVEITANPLMTQNPGWY